MIKDPNLISYRTAKVTDLKVIQNLFVETINQTCKQDYSKAQLKVWLKSIENKDRWFNAINDQYFLLAEKEQQLLGFGSLKLNNYVDFLYTSPKAQQQGIAKGILKELIKKANKAKQNKVTSDVSITAKPFFLKQGFKVLKTNKNMVHDQILINYKMELIL